MEESYRKGVASHPGPEPCVASRKAAIEALTGGNAGWVLNCEIIALDYARGHLERHEHASNHIEGPPST